MKLSVGSIPKLGRLHSYSLREELSGSRRTQKFLRLMFHHCKMDTWTSFMQRSYQVLLNPLLRTEEGLEEKNFFGVNRYIFRTSNNKKNPYGGYCFFKISAPKIHAMFWNFCLSRRRYFTNRKFFVMSEGSCRSTLAKLGINPCLEKRLPKTQNEI